MLSDKQIKEVKEHLGKARNPVFFFDNDADGLCSFLVLSRSIGCGKGVAIKSFPGLSKNYVRKLYELKPDYVFILDKPVVEKGFVEEANKLNMPVVWIDHHETEQGEMEGVYSYNVSNPPKGVKKSTEPVSYWAWKITKQDKDLWLAMAGCIGDSFIPDFKDKFEKKYPELWKEVEKASQALYETGIGKLSRVFDFALKDRTSKVVKMIKKLLKVKSPYEILEGSNKILERYNQINKKYSKLIEKARKESDESKLLYFQYGGDLSLSGDIANELQYRFPDKIILVAYMRGSKANISLRGNNVKEITEKALEGLEASGGGHENATGAKVNIEDLPEFKERIGNMVS